MDYEKFKIKEYKYWNVFLYKNQYYLGRVYIWSKDEKAMHLFDRPLKEISELMQIIQDIKKAYEKLFQPDILNYAIFRNVAPHLHIHVIPRYEKVREFEGITFTDKNWGKNYGLYPRDFKILEEVTLKIRDMLKEELHKS